ncbi:Ig domain-containing protein [Myxococcota bacterium]|nr:Ig domain-containing protein [Myxococcota bacterium]
MMLDRRILRSAGGLALGLILFSGSAASALPRYGTFVDTTCTANGWTPAKPFNPNGANASDPSKVSCGLCHTNAASPNGGLKPAGDQFRRSGHSDVTPFCSAAVANRPPVFAAVGAQSATVGSPYSLTVSATDPEGGAVLLSVANAPTGSTFTDAGNRTGTLVWTPTAAQLGAHTLTFHAADTGTPMGVASLDVTIAVGQAANRPPVLAPIGNQQLDPGQNLAFTLSAQDPEGQALVFAATGLPTGAILVGASFTWTPDTTQTGQHAVTFSVSDSGVPAASDSESIVITVGRINRPPVLAAIGNRQVQLGSELRIALSASDPDADPIALDCTGLPADAIFMDHGDGTGEIVWAPTAAARLRPTCSATDAGTPPERDAETFDLAALDATSAAAPRVEDASWSAAGGRFFVQGRVPARMMRLPRIADAREREHGRGDRRRAALDVFAVLSDGSTVLLGSRHGSRSGRFAIDLEPFVAPCSVAVGNAGAMSTAIPVRNAPADCNESLLTRIRATLACDGSSLRISGERGPIGGSLVVSDASDGALLGIIPVMDRSGRFFGAATPTVAPTAIDVRGELAGSSFSLVNPVPVAKSHECDDDEDEDDEDEEEDD